MIARVDGFCLGGGLELAMACDLIVASRAARFGQPEAVLGVIAGWGGTWRLPRHVGLCVGQGDVLHRQGDRGGRGSAASAWPTLQASRPK